MPDMTTLFNNPDKAMAILMHLSKSHEVAVLTITELNKELFKATSIANQERNFLEKLNEINIPQSMLDNVEAAIDARENFAKFLLSGNAKRVDYDSYMMEMYSFVIDACAIGQQLVSLMGNSNDQFNVRDIIADFDTIFKHVYDLFQQLLVLSVEQVKEYASL